MLLLLLLAAASGQSKIDRVFCDGLIFHDVYYDRYALFKDLGRPTNLVMHKYTNTLFFSQTIRRGGAVDFIIRACSIGDKGPTCHDIKEVAGGYAVAYDSGNDDVYFGGHNGIYKYNFLTKKADFFSEEEKSIWALFIRRNFYYIEYPSQILHVYQDERFVPVAEAENIEVDNFYVSRKGEIYIYNRTALYKAEKMSRRVVVLDDQINLQQIAEDSYGDVYFCALDGVYLEEKPYRRIKKIASFSRGHGLTFDEKDNVIYSDSGTIYRLKPSNKTEVCGYKIMSE